ncbi:MAG: glycosyltransferase, partial [Nitrosopumilaceae archaeon]
YIGMVFSEIAHKYGIPFVISPWGSLQSEARLLKKNLKIFADMQFTNKLIRHAYFHSVGASETEALIRLGASPSKIYRIDNPVNLEDFKIKKKTNIFERIHFDKKNKYLLFLSRIDKKKGLELLLHSFKKIRDANQNIFLIIAGSGENAYTEEIKKLVSDLHITEVVRFTGFVSEDEKLELLESAKVFVLTSHSDVHPVAVQEALTMGVPVIITKNSDYPEVEEYNAGILVDEDEQSVFNAIMNLLSNENKLLHMSNNAKELIKQRFLLKDQIKKYEDMYNDIIKKEKRIA